MKFFDHVSQVSGGMSRMSYYRSMLWLALAAIVLLAAGSSAVWNVQGAAAIPPDHVGGTVPPSECKQGNLVARPDIAGTTSSSSVQFLPLQNDTAVPGGQGKGKGKKDLDATTAITLTSVMTPSHGTAEWAMVDATTTLTYTPDTGFTGSDGFKYSIIDECGRTATGKVNVVVFRDDMPTTPAIISRPPSPGLGAKHKLTLPVSATLSIPDGVFAETNDETDLHHFEVTDLGAPDELPAGPGQRSASVAFRLDEFRNGEKVAGSTFAEPLTLEIVFEGQGEPQLFYWDEENNEWRSEGIDLLSYDPETGIATFAIHHLTDFGLFGESDPEQTTERHLFLPSLVK